MKFEKYFDHTILKPDATSTEVKNICKEAVTNGFASVCVNTCYTLLVKEQLGHSGVSTCVVVGFPLGAMSTAAKEFETAQAVKEGADEIDMVIAVGALKEGAYEYVLNDIKAVRSVCEGKVLKVIIETCLLTNQEKIKACQLSVEAGADFVKTSTGFQASGASAADVTLMKNTVDGKAKVKASGGIRDYETAIAMIEAGADRLGTSTTVKIVKAKNK